MSDTAGYVARRTVRLMSVAPEAVLSGLLTIDGVVTVHGDLVCLKDQGSAENGFWIARAGDWKRDPGADPLGYGTHVYATEGTQAGQVWHITTRDPIEWGTTVVAFGRVDGAAGASDHKVNVTGADVLPGYLDAKVDVVAPLIKSVTAPGGDEGLQLEVSDFGASGVPHARGAVPDPGAVAGTTKFLREDATWAVPPAGGAGTFGGGTMTFAGQRATATVVDAGVIAGSPVSAWLQFDASAPGALSAYMHQFLQAFVALTVDVITPGVGFTLVGISQVDITGTLCFKWQRG